MNRIRCRRGWNIPVTEATCFRDWNCILLGVLQSSHRTEKIMGKQQDYFSVTMRILRHPLCTISLKSKKYLGRFLF